MSALEKIEKGDDILYLARITGSIKIVGPWANIGSDIGSYTGLPANFVTRVNAFDQEYEAVGNLQELIAIDGAYYFFDRNTKTLYAKGFTTGVVTFYHLIEFEVCVCSKEIAYLRDPLDEGSEETQYFGGLSSNVSTSKSSENTFTGFMPSLSSSISITNVNYALSFLLRNANLSRKSVKVYVIGGRRKPENTFLVFSGITTSVSFDDKSIGIEISDVMFNFDGNYNYRGQNLGPYSFDTLDPRASNAYPRVVYGMVNCVEAINAAYDEEGDYTTGTNNSFIICHHYGSTLDSSALAFTTTSGSTTTSLNFTMPTPAISFFPGDEILDSDFNHYAWIVSSGGSHTEVLSPVGAGQTMYRDRIGMVSATSRDNFSKKELKRNQTGTLGDDEYKLSLVDNTLYIEIKPSADTAFDGLPVNTRIMARVYGEKNTLGSDYLFNSTNTSINHFWNRILYEYLAQEMGFSFNELNASSFEISVNGFFSGLLIPLSANSNPERHREIINPLLQAGVASVTGLNSGLISLSSIFSAINFTTDFTIDSDEIISIRYSEDYLDTAKKVELSHSFGDATGGPQVSFGLPTTFRDYSLNPGSSLSTKEDVNIYSIFLSNSTRSYSAYIYRADDITLFLNRIYSILAYPFAVVTVKLPMRYLEKTIGQSVLIDRKGLPGLFSARPENFGTEDVNYIVGRVIGIDFDGYEVTLKIWVQLTTTTITGQENQPT